MQSCNHNEKARAFQGTGLASTTEDHTVSGCAIAPFQFRKGGILKERTAVGGHGINRGQQRTIKRRIDPRFAPGNGNIDKKPCGLLDIIIDDHIGKTGCIGDRVAIFKHSRQMHGQCLRGIAIAFLDRIPGTGTTGNVWEEGAKSASFIGFNYDRKSLLHGAILFSCVCRVSGSSKPDTALFLYAPKGSYFQILFRMRDCDAPRLGGVAEMMMASCRLNFEPSVRLDPLDDFSALHHPSVVDALYIHTFAHRINRKVCINVYYLCLTTSRNRRMVQPIGGNNPPWGRRNSLFKTVSRHVSCGYFCARNPGASSRLGREGGEYKTLRGNKPACLLTGFEPPATSAVVESRSGGVVKRHQEGFNMTDKTISHDQLETVEQAAMLLNQLYDGLEGIALLIEAGHKEQAASIARMATTACLMVTPPIENTIAELDGPIDISPQQPFAWPERGE